MLLSDIWKFCDRDVSYKTVDTYYEHAELFKDDVIQDILAGFLAEQVRENTWAIPPTSVVMMDVSACTLWAKIAERLCISKYFQDSNNSPYIYRMSILVARVLKSQRDGLDIITFQLLTAKDKMPRVDPSVALALCELEEKVMAACEDKFDESLSCLQKRCAEGLSQKWKNLAAVGVTKKKLVQRKTTFLVHLVLCCAKAATKADAATIERELWKGQNPLNYSNDRLVQRIEELQWKMTLEWRMSMLRSSKKKWSGGPRNIQRPVTKSSQKGILA